MLMKCNKKKIEARVQTPLEIRSATLPLNLFFLFPDTLSTFIII